MLWLCFSRMSTPHLSLLSICKFRLIVITLHCNREMSFTYYGVRMFSVLCICCQVISLLFSMHVNCVFIQTSGYTELIFHMMIKWITLTQTESRPPWWMRILGTLCVWWIGHPLIIDLLSGAIWVACAWHSCDRKMCQHEQQICLYIFVLCKYICSLHALIFFSWTGEWRKMIGVIIL